MKFLFVIILVIMGVIYFIIRNIDNARSKYRGARIVKKLKENPEYLKELLASVSWMAVKRKFENNIRVSIDSCENKTIGKVKILYAKKIDSSKYIFVTICSDIDFDLNITGKMSDVKNEYQMTFLFKIDSTEGNILVYTEMYNDLQSKNLILDGIDILLKEYFTRKG